MLHEPYHNLEMVRRRFGNPVYSEITVRSLIAVACRQLKIKEATASQMEAINRFKSSGKMTLKSQLLIASPYDKQHGG